MIPLRKLCRSKTILHPRTSFFERDEKNRVQKILCPLIDPRLKFLQSEKFAWPQLSLYLCIWIGLPTLSEASKGATRLKRGQQESKVATKWKKVKISCEFDTCTFSMKKTSWNPSDLKRKINSKGAQKMSSHIRSSGSFSTCFHMIITIHTNSIGSVAPFFDTYFTSGVDR